MIELQKGTMNDVDDIAGIYDDLNDYLAAHTNYPGWIKGVYPNRETAEEGVKSGNLFILRCKGRAVGTLILNHEPEDGYEHVNWQNHLDYKDIFVIHTFAVHPLSLNQGLGMELMRWAVDYCRKAGAKAIRLDTYEKNMPAIHLYKKCGFEYMGKVDLGYGEYGLDYFELYQLLL